MAISDMFNFDSIADDDAKARRGQISNMMADSTPTDNPFKRLPNENLNDYAKRTQDTLRQMRIDDANRSPFNDMIRYMSAKPNAIYGQ